MSEEKIETPNAEATPKAAEPPRRKRRWMRLLLKVVGVFALLLVVALVIGRMALPGVVRSQAETRLSEMLGVAVTVGDVDLSLLGGSAYIDELSIAQPQGFEGAPLFASKRLGASIATASLMGETIVVEELLLADATASIRRNAQGLSNVDVILQNLGVEEPGEQPADEAPAQPEEVPAETSEDDEPDDESSKGIGKIILIERILVGSLDIDFLDETRPADTNSGAFHVGVVDLESLQYADPGVETGLPETVVTVKDLSIKTGEKFENPVFLSFDQFVIQLDLGRVLYDPEVPDILVTKLRLDGMRAVTEEFDRKRGNANIAEFVRVAAGSLGHTIPEQSLYPDLDDDDLEEEAKEAAKAAQKANGEKTKSEESEEEEDKSGGLLGGIFGSDKKGEEDDADEKEVETEEPQTQPETPEANQTIELKPSGLISGLFGSSDDDEDDSAEKDRSDEPAFKRLEIVNLTVSGMSFLEIDHRKETRKAIDDVYVDLRDIVMPYEPGNQSLVTLRAKPWDENASVVAKLQGELLKEGRERDMVISFVAEKIPMSHSDKYAGGILDADLDLDVVGGHATGELDFSIQGFKVSERERKELADVNPLNVPKMMRRNALMGLEKVSELGAPTINVAIDYHLEAESPAAVMFSLYIMIISQAQNIAVGVAKGLAEGAVKAVGEGAKLAGDAATGAADAAINAPGAAADLAGDAAKKTGEAVGGVTGAVGGLLGGGKDKDKDEKKKED